MKLTILLLALLFAAACRKRTPPRPPTPPCSADLFGCYSDDPRAHCVSCDRFWNNLDKRKASK